MPYAVKTNPEITHFSLRQAHVFLPRRLVPQHHLPGSAPARNTLYLPRTTPRRPPGAQLRAPTPRRRHFARVLGFEF